MTSDYSVQFWIACAILGYIGLVGQRVASGLRERNRLLEASNKQHARGMEETAAFQQVALQDANARAAVANAVTRELTSALRDVGIPTEEGS